MVILQCLLVIRKVGEYNGRNGLGGFSIIMRVLRFFPERLSTYLQYHPYRVLKALFQ